MKRVTKKNSDEEASAVDILEKNIPGRRYG
jgi:hypothetical protein